MKCTGGRSQTRRLIDLLDVKSGVLTACALVLTTSCTDETTLELTTPVRPAKLIEIVSSSATRDFKFPAIIEASESADLNFQVNGLLQEIFVREGQQIQRNELIAELDQRGFRDDFIAAQASYNTAESEFHRAMRLMEQSAISTSHFEDRRTQRDIAQVQINRSRQALEDSVLRSPFDGIVAEVHAEAFQNVKPQDPIVTIQTIGTKVAVVHVPARVVANAARIVAPESFVYLDSNPDVHVPATFYSSTTQADANTLTFEVRFAFEPPADIVVAPGMTGFVYGRLPIQQTDGQSEEIRIPLGAIVSEGDSQYVWSVNTETMTVSRRDVVLEPGIGETLRVTSGLAPGDVIVGAGASYLYEGMQIRPYQP